ncbi:DUF4214 domain-containing protein [Roseomonas sp. HF4]|uniref:DUF4214 domain-containing protein n=1 Tax=Roseomonas sp. HF4 TaxID=2562313 RepID=UPI0010C02959|nr:DUF4214 domain-containing protein [Roseomonas sp. HF4]
MREVNGTELLAGSDHEFVVNLYTVILNRWPDEDGYRHHLEKVENRPDQRRRIVTDVANSAEARGLGVVLRFEGDPPPAPPGAKAAPAPAAAAAAPAPAGGDLADALARLRAGLEAMRPAELAAAQRLLAETLAALAAHQADRVEARLAALEARPGA